MILVDINVFEDVIRKREGWEGSFGVLNKVRSEDVAGGISALTVPVLYFLRRLPDRKARKKVKETIQGFGIIDLTSEIINDAMNDWEFVDFEDAIQFYSAKSANAKIIITRNKKHFRVVEGKINVLTPEEFLA
jgi:predicted nucleic acid-binding protein